MSNITASSLRDLGKKMVEDGVSVEARLVKKEDFDEYIQLVTPMVKAQLDLTRIAYFRGVLFVCPPPTAEYDGDEEGELDDE